MPRRRLGSVSDNSAPASDSSEGSETYEIAPADWSLEQDNHMNIESQHNSLFINSEEDSLSSENSGVVTDGERGQVESFFSGLGTEVFISYIIDSKKTGCL